MEHTPIVKHKLARRTPGKVEACTQTAAVAIPDVVKFVFPQGNDYAAYPPVGEPEFEANDYNMCYQFLLSRKLINFMSSKMKINLLTIPGS
jgi:hypothetical protein